ncbi:MAG: peptide chain release factor 1 [Firmicutes bacterium]|nr:peptide chain release factor 1 [Bacillota bacterium]
MNLEKLKKIKNRYEALAVEVVNPAVIAKGSEWTKLVKEHAELEPVVVSYDALAKTDAEIEDAKELLKDPSMRELAEIELEELKERRQKIFDELRVLLLPKDPRDGKDVLMEIRAGAGGDEAALFGNRLMRMYKMYAAANRWKVEDIDVNYTELDGVKEAVFSISGSNVFSKLKFESGVHRVQRVPATETQGRVHTSTVTVAVLAEAEEVAVEINEKDLKIDTYRAGGAGGQHVNRTDSAVRITHIPTGIIVQCQDERSQLKNRDKAMRALRAKMYDMLQSKADAEYAKDRKNQVGTGDRSERIRTYNFPQGRVTDHRIGMTIYSLDNFMEGDIGEMLEALRIADQQAKLEG